SGCCVGSNSGTNGSAETRTAEVAPDRVRPARPTLLADGRPWRPTQHPRLPLPDSLALEKEIFYGRLEAARAYAAANRLNRITVPTPDAWLGIVAAGKTYYDVREALAA